MSAYAQGIWTSASPSLGYQLRPRSHCTRTAQMEWSFLRLQHPSIRGQLLCSPRERVDKCIQHDLNGHISSCFALNKFRLIRTSCIIVESKSSFAAWSPSTCSIHSFHVFRKASQSLRHCNDGTQYSSPFARVMGRHVLNQAWHTKDMTFAAQVELNVFSIAGKRASNS
jgi:hypothetical protein